MRHKNCRHCLPPQTRLYW